MKKILMIGYIEFDRDPRVLREAKCLNEKHMVNVISLQNENLKGEVIFEGIKVFCVNQNRNMSNNKFNYIIEYLKFMYKAFHKSLVLTLKNNYDVYYFHNIPDFLVFIAFLQKVLLRKKIVLDVHDPMAFSLKSRFQLSQKSLIYKFIKVLEKLSWEFSNQIITVNEPCKKLIQAIVKKEITVIMNLPDDDLFISENQNSISSNNRILLYHGTITPWYGLDIAIEAIKIIKEKIPEIRLIIIGKGSEKENLIKKVRKFGLFENVKILDSVPQREIVNFIEQSWMGISTHQDIAFSEIYFSTKVVEFLKMNRMVICSRTKGIQEYFTEEEVVYFDPGNVEDLANKIYYCYKNPKFIEQKLLLVDNKIQKLNWTNEKYKLIKLIDDI